jgi:hypothetical protein
VIRIASKLGDSVVPDEIAWTAHRYLKKQAIRYNHRDIEAQRRRASKEGRVDEEWSDVEKWV